MRSVRQLADGHQQRRNSIRENATAPPLRAFLPSLFVDAVHEIDADDDNPSDIDIPLSNSDISLDPTNSTTSSVCSRCQGKARKSHSEETVYSDDFNVTAGDVADSVIQVVNKIRVSRKTRTTIRKQDELNAIMDRVQEALKHSNIEFDDDNVEYPQFLGLDIAGKQSKQEKRSWVMDSFELSESLSKSRDEVISDIQTWLLDINEDLKLLYEEQEETDQVLTDEEFYRRNKRLRKTIDALNRLSKYSSLIKKKKKGKEATTTKPGDETAEKTAADSAAKEKEADKVQPIKKVFTEKELNQWTAVHKVMKVLYMVLEDGCKAAAMSGGLKNNFRVAHRQMRILEKVLKKKLEKIIELEEKVRQLSIEAANVQHLKEERKGHLQKIDELNEQLSVTKTEVNFLSECLEKMKVQLVDSCHTPDIETESHMSIPLPSDEEIFGPESIERIITPNEEVKNDLQKTMTGKKEQKKPVAVIPASSLQMSDSRRSRSADSLRDIVSGRFDSTVSTPTKRVMWPDEDPSFHISVDAPVQQTQQEETKYDSSCDEDGDDFRDEYKKDVAKYRKMSTTLTRRRSSKGGDKHGGSVCDFKIGRLEMLLTKSMEENNVQRKDLNEERDKNEDLSLTVERLRSEIEALRDQERMRAKGISRDKIVLKTQYQHQNELRRLRDFIQKEQYRFQANLRKNNIEHENYVTHLRQEKEKMIRSLLRFRKMMESNISKDTEDLSVETTTEYEEKIRVFINNNEGMVIPEPIMETLISMEKNVKKILLKKHLVEKESNSYKQSTEKSLQQYRERLQKTTDDYHEQEFMAKQAVKHGETIAKHHDELIIQNEVLQKELITCKHIHERYNTLKQEVERLTSIGRKSCQEMNNTVESYEQSNADLRGEIRRLRFDKPNDRLKLTNDRISCKDKVFLVRRAFEWNQLSMEKQDAAVKVLDYTNTVILTQFAELVKRYIEYNRVDKMKKNLIKLGVVYVNQIRFQKYLERITQRYFNEQIKWEKRKQELNSIKQKSFMLYNTLIHGDEVGELEVRSRGLFNKKIENVERKHKKLPKYVQPRICTPSQILDDLVGKRLITNTPVKSYWQAPPDTLSKTNIRITTPKIVELDVQSWKRDWLLKKTKKRVTRLPPIATLFP